MRLKFWHRLYIYFRSPVYIFWGNSYFRNTLYKPVSYQVFSLVDLLAVLSIDKILNTSYLYRMAWNLNFSIFFSLKSIHLGICFEESTLDFSLIFSVSKLVWFYEFDIYVIWCRQGNDSVSSQKLAQQDLFLWLTFWNWRGNRRTEYSVIYNLHILYI